MRTSKTIACFGFSLICLSSLQGGGVEDDPRFIRGKALFDRGFHIADGLGTPDFNANSCRACHSDPEMGGAGALELNVSRFGSEQGGVFTDLPGGQAVSKLRPPNGTGREEYDVVEANCFEQRQTPTLFGAGLIDSIADAVIIANEDPTDADANGIFGVARRVDIGGTIEIGKFGWKAQIPRLHDFTRDALQNEIGLTTPDNVRGFGIDTDGDTVADPEVPSTDIDDLTFFISNLPRPQRGGSNDPRVAQGEALFQSVGCAICHIPVLQGSGGPVPLYSNLLVHNVMPPGYRGMSEPGAAMGFFRTPPLWGIKDTAPYLHDGRAEDIPGAILAHAGEAAGVVANYNGLSAAEQEALLLFLEDL